MTEERKYRIKNDWIFNLEAMYDRLWCVIYDIRDDKITLPVIIAGKTINSEDDIQELLEESSELEWIAKSRKVTSKEYGRIKEMVEWRVMARYVTCLASGMDEKDAGKCFEDL